MRQALAEYLLKIYELQDAFKGTEWNGQNHVGVWDSDYEQRREDGYRPFRYMEECLSFFWTPEEWFDARNSNDWQMKRKWELGLTVEEIIDTEDLGGAHCQGQCDRNAAIEWMNKTVERWAQKREVPHA